MDTMAVWAAGLLGLIAGGALAGVLCRMSLLHKVALAQSQLEVLQAERLRTEQDLQAQLAQKSQELTQKGQELAAMSAEKANLDGLQTGLNRQVESLLREKADLNQAVVDLQNQKNDIAQRNAAMVQELETHKQWIGTVESKLTEQMHAFMVNNVDTVKKDAEGEYQTKQQMLEEKVKLLLAPLQKMVVDYQQTVAQVDKEHHTNKELIDAELKRLIQSTTKLSAALTFNKGRGDWGELELRRLLEDSGMQEGISFQAQVVLENRKRPDFKILMPGDRVLFVDSKALQFDPQWFADDDASPESMVDRQKKYVTSLRQAVKGLADREYQNELKESAGFVVLYVPREAMLSNALMLDPGLFEEAYKQKVILAGPLNVMAILKAIEHSWVMAQQSQRALTILKETQNLYVKAASFVGNFNAIGKGLQQTVKAYHDTVTTFEGHGGLIGRLQKFEQMGYKHKDKLLAEVTHVDFEHQPLKNSALADNPPQPHDWPEFEPVSEDIENVEPVSLQGASL